MSINGINNTSFQASTPAQRISSGNRINSAADDAAGLAIASKMDSQVRGLEQGINNTQDMQNLLRTAEGGMSNIADSLQRVRELTLQASNGIYTDEDRQLIQYEINDIMQEIGDTANRVQFNNIDVLNSDQSLHTASNPDGSGATVNLRDMSGMAEELVRNLDVTEQATESSAASNINAIDSAITEVNAARAELGAMSNRMDHTINSNSVTMLNQAAARSRINDTDMAREATNHNREQVLNDVQIMMQQQEMTQQQNNVQLLL